MKKLVIKKREVGKVEDIEIPEERLCRINLGTHYNLEIDGKKTYMAERRNGEFEGRAIYLDSVDYDWVLGRDSLGNVCLIPLKKGREENV